MTTQQASALQVHVCNPAWLCVQLHFAYVLHMCAVANYSMFCFQQYQQVCGCFYTQHQLLHISYAACPASAARCRGVFPTSLRASTLTSVVKRILTTSACPFIAATCRGVLCTESAVLHNAFFSASERMGLWPSVCSRRACRQVYTCKI